MISCLSEPNEMKLRHIGWRETLYESIIHLSTWHTHTLTHTHTHSAERGPVPLYVPTFSGTKSTTLVQSLTLLQTRSFEAPLCYGSCSVCSTADEQMSSSIAMQHRRTSRPRTHIRIYAHTHTVYTHTHKHASVSMAFAHNGHEYIQHNSTLE